MQSQGGASTASSRVSNFSTESELEAIFDGALDAIDGGGQVGLLHAVAQPPPVTMPGSEAAPPVITSCKAGAISTLRPKIPALRHWRQQKPLGGQETKAAATAAVTTEANGTLVARVLVQGQPGSYYEESFATQEALDEWLQMMA